MSNELQQDIDALAPLAAREQYTWEAFTRIRARLTPDREMVFAAITETLIKFGHDDATMLQDCIFAADAAIAAMGGRRRERHPRPDRSGIRPNL